MFWFGRRRPEKTQQALTADTFVEATGGGWGGMPEEIAVDGGSQKDFVEETLGRARNYALEHNVPVGEVFKFTITDIPIGISSPHEIVFGLMMKANEYGLDTGVVTDETVEFVRRA